MSFILKCNKCGFEAEIKPEKVGEKSYRFNNAKFLIKPFDYNDNIVIECQNCGHKIKEDCFGHYHDLTP